jgi:hypothetical protein
VFDFTRADAKRKRTKRTVSARVTVAANDRHAGLSQAKLWSNDVNDALFRRVNIEELNAKFFAVSPQCFDLLRRGRVSDRETAIGSGDVVIDSAESKIRASYFAACLAQTIKRLRRRHLVNEVQIDVKERRLTTHFTNNVRLPKLVEKCTHT